MLDSLAASCNCDAAVRFAAVKLTAIVNPHLLVSISNHSIVKVFLNLHFSFMCLQCVPD